MQAFAAAKSAAVLLVMAVLLASACSDLNIGGAAAAETREVEVGLEIHVNGLQVRLDRVNVTPDRVRVDVVVQNPTDATYALLLGGCGPSQGWADTASRRVELYYSSQRGNPLGGAVPPGASRHGTLTLMVKGGDALEPAAVTELKLHPGYVYNPETGALKLLEATLSLQGSDGPR